MKKLDTSARALLAAIAAIALVACDGGGTTDAGTDAADRVTDIVQTDTPATDAIDANEDVTLADGNDGSTDAAADVPADTAGCEGDGGCWACPPTTDHQFLNQCTTSTCSHFDNSRVTRLLPDGGLPPLP